MILQVSGKRVLQAEGENVKSYGISAHGLFLMYQRVSQTEKHEMVRPRVSQDHGQIKQR